MNPETKPFWDAADGGRLVLPRCRSCGGIIWYPRTYCPECQGRDVEWIEASGRGTVDTYTVVRRGAFGPYAEVMPYVLAYVELEEGPRVFTTAADLVARCHKAAIEGRWATTMLFYAGPAVLVIDELGYLPLPKEAASALFQVVSQRYLKGSTILTTNPDVGPAWSEIFNDSVVAVALLDRLLHRCTLVQIDGPSYRMRAHRARVEALRATFTGTALSPSEEVVSQTL